MESAMFRRIAGAIRFKLLILFPIFILSFLIVSCADDKNPEAQRAYLTPDILCGTVQFTDGCSPKLDTLISFGIALLHHMTYEDAEYTFNQVIELDKDCFWGYWGKAMTYIHPLWPDVPDSITLDKGYQLSQNALSLAKSEKEKLYASAVAAYFETGYNKTETERLSAFKNGWQFASKELPDDIESRMFSVLTMLATVPPTDKSYDIQREAGAIAEQTLEIIPDHPAGFHYAIHAYDVPPLANNALRVARNYFKIAPEIPHALHMPSHIFTRLGYWQESIEMNSRSANAAWKLPAGNQISGHYFHALDYLAYAYLQKSEIEKAMKVAELLDTLNGTFQPVGATAYSLAAVQGRIFLETQQWSEAAEIVLNNRTNFPWEKFPQYEALVYYAKGIGAGRSGNTEVAEECYQKLQELQNTFKDTQTYQYWITQIEIQKTAVNALELYAKKENEKSIEMMKIAADLEDATEKNPVTPGHLLPVREMLGDLLMEMNRPEEALAAYELSMINNPNRFNSLYGAGKSAEMIGNVEKAKTYFAELLKLNEGSKPNRKQITYAENIVNNKM
ncbi:MAG: hypothetical protein R6W68_14560 [Ignavibacteriaceae bacterium]